MDQNEERIREENESPYKVVTNRVGGASGNKSRNCCFGCLSACVFLVIGLGFTFFQLNKKAETEIDPIIRAYFDAIDNANWEAAYELADPNLEKETFIEQSRSYAYLGKIQTLSRTSVIFGKKAGADTTAEANYIASNGEGDLHLEIHLEKRMDILWRITYINGNSSFINDAMRCSKCQNANSFSDAFCGKCSTPTNYPWKGERSE